MADLAPLDLLDQPPHGITSRAFAGESTLRGLRPVAAPVDKAPAEDVGGPVRVHASGATMAGGVGAPSDGGDLNESLIESAGRGLGREPAGTPTSGRVSPADFPAASVEAGTHCVTSSVLSRAPIGRTEGTYLSRDNSTSILGRISGPRDGSKKPRGAGFFQCAREDSNLHGPFSPQGPQPWTARVDASRSVQGVQNCEVPWTDWTGWTQWMLSRALSRRVTTSAV